MNFLARLRSMTILGRSLTGVASRSHHAVIVRADNERAERLGDIEGQTERARQFAAELDTLVIKP